jgi:hypothetical protein
MKLSTRAIRAIIADEHIRGAWFPDNRFTIWCRRGWFTLRACTAFGHRTGEGKRNHSVVAQAIKAGENALLALLLA